VTRRALNLFLDGNPSIASSPDALITALNYVVPQINKTPNVCGFSPVQWTLGYIPHVPGLLMEEQNLHNPATLDPSEAFMEKLRLKQQAVKATSEADGPADALEHGRHMLLLERCPCRIKCKIEVAWTRHCHHA
jgi:hypothetical protein